MWKSEFDFNISKCLLSRKSYKKQIPYLLWLIWYHNTHSWRVHSPSVHHPQQFQIGKHVCPDGYWIFKEVPFSSALMTNIMLLDSGDLNLTIFCFDNFSPSSAFIKGKTCIYCHVGRSGCFKRRRTPEGEQRTLLGNMQEPPIRVPSVSKEKGFWGRRVWDEHQSWMGQYARAPAHLLLLSSSCSVYTRSPAACVLGLLSPHLSFRLWGPDAAHSSLGGKGGNGRVFALMNWLNGPTPISLMAWILILKVGK